MILLVTWAVFTSVQGYAITKTGVSCNVAGLDSAISNLILGIIGVLTVLIFKFYQPGKANRLYRAAYVIAVVIIYHHAITLVLNTVFTKQRISRFH
ncbi:MAG: hypothetical protein IPG08_09870 [Sphingobacteriaceae bacterium]|nr:hypothetical protein [Sphingobacteriaceae bacterium]